MSKPASTKPLPLGLGTSLTISTAFATIRSLYATLKLNYIGRDIIENRMSSSQGYILAIWHCNVLLSPIIHRNFGVLVMVSLSRDGDIISGVVERLGNIPVRGSSSKEGRRALAAMITALSEGKCAAITPDGPLGPYMKLKSGVVAMAQKAGVPIIPCHYEADRQWQLPSWDRQLVPKPFSTLTVRYGEPIPVPKELSYDEFEAHLVKVERAVLANVRACRKAAGRA